MHGKASLQQADTKARPPKFVSFKFYLSKKIIEERVVDEQMIDANVTIKEVENLMEYNEAMDVISDFAMDGDSNIDEEDEQMDDDLLKELIKKHGRWFMEVYFSFNHKNRVIRCHSCTSQ